jgi:hypothetical protein
VLQILLLCKVQVSSVSNPSANHQLPASVFRCPEILENAGEKLSTRMRRLLDFL